MIAGLYPYARGGVIHPPKVTLFEIPVSLRVNPSYPENRWYWPEIRPRPRCCENSASPSVRLVVRMV